MKNKLSAYVGLPSLLLTLFLMPTLVHATTLIQQTDSTQHHTDAWGATTNLTQTIGSGLPSVTSSTIYLTLNVCEEGTPNTNTINLNSYPDNAYSSATTVASTNDKFTQCSVASTSLFTFTTATINPALWYGFVILPPTDTYDTQNCNDGASGNTCASFSPSLQGGGGVSGNTYGWTFANTAFAFNLASNPPAPPVVPQTLQFEYPFNGTSTPNFRNWLLSFNVNTSTNRLYQLQINYGTSTGANTWQDIFPSLSGTQQSTAGFLPIRTTVQKGVAFFSGETIYARALLQTVDANTCPNWIPCAPIVTTSTEISFTIDNTKTINAYTFLDNASSSLYATSSAAIANNFSTAAQFAVQVQNPVIPNNFFGSTGVSATSTLASTTRALAAQCPPPADWTDIGGGLYYAGCSVINFLFVPNPEVQQGYYDNVNALTNTFPFSLLWANYTVLGNTLNTQTVTSTPITITDAPSPDGSTSTWVMNDLNTIPQTDNFGRVLFGARQAWYNFFISLVMGLLVLMVIIIIRHRQ